MRSFRNVLTRAFGVWKSARRPVVDLLCLGPPLDDDALPVGPGVPLEPARGLKFVDALLGQPGGEVVVQRERTAGYCLG